MLDSTGKNSQDFSKEPSGSRGIDACAANRQVDKLLPDIYSELRSLASKYLGGPRGSAGLTIQPTVLVHEAYIRLARNMGIEDASKSHFFAIAATAVKHTLRDHVKSKGRQKRGGDQKQLPLTIVDPASPDGATIDFHALDRALEDFRSVDPRAARVVDLRFFAGLTEVEIADVIGISERTVRNDWAMARAWLLKSIKGGAADA